MNHHHDEPVPSLDDAGEREWLAQENALRRERLGLDDIGDDARTQRYRLLARALHQPPTETLPEDFARQVAVLAGAVPGRRTAMPRFEIVLTAVLAGALLLAAAAVTAAYGSAWLPSFDALRPSTPSLRWLLALAACLGASAALGRWPRHAGRG
jgi:hypothetical protein